METKANINLKEGTVELTGSEEFVSKYLDVFKELLIFDKPGDHERSHREAETQIESTVENSVKESKSGARKILKSGKPTKSKSIAIEKFDLHKDAKNMSLEDFLKDKSPGKTTANIISVIAYYITVLKGSPIFSEGNIDYAYRTLSISGRPTHLHQIMINAKNKQDFFEPAEGDGVWKLTRTGEIFVDEKLPPKVK